MNYVYSKWFSILSRHKFCALKYILLCCWNVRTVRFLSFHHKSWLIMRCRAVKMFRQQLRVQACTVAAKLYCLWSTNKCSMNAHVGVGHGRSQQKVFERGEQVCMHCFSTRKERFWHSLFCRKTLFWWYVTKRCGPRPPSRKICHYFPCGRPMVSHGLILRVFANAWRVNESWCEVCDVVCIHDVRRHWSATCVTSTVTCVHTWRHATDLQYVWRQRSRAWTQRRLLNFINVNT